MNPFRALPATPGADRLTWKSFFVHEQYDSGAAPAIEFVASKRLESSAQVFERRMVLDENWISLESLMGAGWDSVGLVVVENRAGMNLKVAPTEEELLVLAQMAILIGAGGETPWRIRANSPPFMGEPADVSQVQLRAEAGRVPMNLYVFPR